MREMCLLSEPVEKQRKSLIVIKQDIVSLIIDSKNTCKGK